jgi:hypothetical protein
MDISITPRRIEACLAKLRRRPRPEALVAASSFFSCLLEVAGAEMAVVTSDSTPTSPPWPRHDLAAFLAAPGNGSFHGAPAQAVPRAGRVPGRSS